MAKEQIVLDPVEVATNRTELALHKDAIQVRPEGPDWGDAAIVAVMSEGTIGEALVDFRIPNRKPSIPLTLLDYNGMTFDEARAALQQKVGTFWREGGWLKRELKDGRKLYADVFNATLKLGGGTFQAQNDLDPEANLELETSPDWYGDEIVGNDHVETIYPELVFLIGASYFDTLLSYTPALYWRLGVNGLDDQTANNRDGTAGGGVTVGGATGALSNEADKATDFDGVDDRVTSTYAAFTNGSTKTFCGWANRDTNGTIDTIFGSDSGTAGAWVRLHIASGASGDVTFTVNGGTNSVTWAAAWPGTVQWVHWALVFNETTDVAELFINGASVGTKTVAQAYNGSSPGFFEIGAHSGSTNPFDGKMDEVAVFTRSLHPVEIRMLRAAGQSDAAVKGDCPARVRLQVDEDDGELQRGLIWGVRARHYSPAPTARLVYPATDLTPVGSASVQALAGSFSGNVLKHNALSGTWAGIGSTELVGLGHMTQTGSYRVLVRAHTTASIPPDLRIIWAVGDLAHPEENRHAPIPLAGEFWLVDLGTVHLRAVAPGAHRWLGQIQGRRGAGASGKDASLDRFYLVPIDEGCGFLTAPFDVAPGITQSVARDGFSQGAVTITGKSADVGGPWAGAGDTTDYSAGGSDAANNKCLTRTAVSDTGVTLQHPGRFITLDTNTAAVGVQATLGWSALAPGVNQLVVARFTNVDNWVAAGIAHTTSSSFVIAFVKRVGAANSTYFSLAGPLPPSQLGVLLTIDADGHWGVWTFLPGASRAQLFQYGRDADLATGGALASGDVGLLDEQAKPDACTRTYTDFDAWPLASNAVLFPNQSAELSDAGMFREDSAGVAYGPIPTVVDALPRLPVGGVTEVFVKGSRGEFELLPDSGIDDISTKVAYRPSWLITPSET